MSDFAAGSFATFLDRLGAKTPTPGGGAVAAAVGALACALAQMVVNYSVAKKSLAAHEMTLRAALDRLVGARDEALSLAAADEQAYAALNELWKLPESDSRRAAQMPAAARAAIAPPRRCLDLALQTLDLLESLAPITNRNLRSDLAIAAVLARAAADAARWNIAVNAPLLPGEAERAEALARAEADCLRAAEACQRIERACV
ncbi:MAG: cyclodeaminase/cyclohydrolase family protein [Phycisphaerales bacterium JB039]